VIFELPKNQQEPMFNKELSNFQIERLQLGLISVFLLIPLFVYVPFKINLFLAWDGAYRISMGQIPFKDFSLPMGFGFWLLPALFFKIFGPSLYSLIITQVFINLIGALAFRSILRKLGVSPAMVLLSLLVYSISFIFVNFWPWYNHTVFIFQLISLHFLLSHIFEQTQQKKILFLAVTSFFLVLAVSTKQDGGGLAVITAAVLILYDAIVTKSIKWILYIAAFSILFACLFILPFIQYDILYWFNYGQSPHNARTSVGDILIDVFEGSQWIKFYLLAIVTILIHQTSSQKEFIKSKKEVLLILITVCILFQAMLVQVTSYIPHNVNIYFHSFAFAFIGHHCLAISQNRIRVISLLTILIMFWWSADYWRYGQRLVNRISPKLVEEEKTLNSVSKYTWFIEDSTKQSKKISWKISKYKSFKHVLLPEGTIVGIDSIMNLEIIRKKDLKVLNMSELTPLAYEIGYKPLVNQPMWFHKNVSIFDREIQTFCNNITEKKYDLVLFEVIPNLNQFYPDAVRKCLQVNYLKIDSFQAPRDNTNCIIEVYVIPSAN
jgi:hypothetical protein